MSNQEIKLYFYQGSRVDSLSTILDTAGKAKLLLVDSNYRGMITVSAHMQGSVDLILAEPVLNLYNNGLELSMATMQYPQSEENLFLSRIFMIQTENMQKQAWIKAGIEIYADNDLLKEKLEQELKTVDASLDKLLKEVDESKLYAADYFRFAIYLNHLFEADRTADKEVAQNLIKEMEQSLNIQALYTSGMLWTSIHNYYISLFNRLDSPTKYNDYATSVCKTLDRFADPYYMAYLTAVISECERFNWSNAQTNILRHVAVSRSDLNASDPLLQRLLSMLRTIEGDYAPAIVGLNDNSFISKTTLLVFYETGCGNCEQEIQQLEIRYPDLMKRGIRVVSIASDMDKAIYDSKASKFPWNDKLCDFKGFEGANFKNYGVLGTPTLILVDKDGKISGRYASLVDISEVVVFHDLLPDQ